MEAVVLTEPGRLRLMETPEPDPPGPGEALVRVHRVGVCGTDLHAFQGRQTFFSYPRILGHELGVEVVTLGEPLDSPSPVQVGDRCAVEAYLHCGGCGACRRGQTNCCVSLRYLGVHIDGGLRPYLTVPTAKLHRSDRLSLDQLALVEMLTIGAHAVDRAHVAPGETVLVLGVGPIGLSVVQFAHAAGVRVLALDMDEARLAFSQRLGVDETLQAGEGALDRVRDLTEGEMPTVVFDATGAPASMNGALAYLAHGGRLVFVGHHPGEVVFPDPEFHRREATLLASRNSTAADYHRVINFVETGVVDTTAWITHRATLADVPMVFPTWLDRGQRVVKAMVDVAE